MKYQAIKHLKTKSKLLKMCDTLKEAHEMIMETGGLFDGLSYMGGFPQYIDNKNYRYSIQGACMFAGGNHIVCSLNQDELQAFNFSII